MTETDRVLLAGAFKRQSQLRLLAFANGEYKYEYAGLFLRALTLSDICELYANGNSFIAGGKLETLDAIQVLWRCSDSAEIDAEKFAKNLLHQFLSAELISEVEKFVDDMFLDSGSWPEEATGETPKKKAPPQYNMASLIVAELARAYHWSAHDILTLPLPQIWQYLHLARKHEDTKYNWKQLTDHLNILIRRRERDNNGIKA